MKTVIKTSPEDLYHPSNSVGGLSRSESKASRAGAFERRLACPPYCFWQRRVHPNPTSLPWLSEPQRKGKFWLSWTTYSVQRLLLHASPSPARSTRGRGP